VARVSPGSVQPLSPPEATRPTRAWPSGGVLEQRMVIENACYNATNGGRTPCVRREDKELFNACIGVGVHFRRDATTLQSLFFPIIPEGDTFDLPLHQSLRVCAIFAFLFLKSHRESMLQCYKRVVYVSRL
jgi:hypothetical protein